MPVTPSVAAALLAYAAATDNREVTEEAARAWSAALHHAVTLADGKAAIDAHRAESTQWLMPAHVNRTVKAMRRERLDRVDPAEEVPPDALRDNPARAATWLVIYRTARGDGEAHAAAQSRACAAVGVAVPTALPPADPARAARLVAQAGVAVKAG